MNRYFSLFVISVLLSSVFVPFLDSYADVITGTGGSDTLNGTPNDDTIDGKGGNDTINGGDGNDTLDGGPGSDTIDGGDGTDKIKGEIGNDKIKGGAGDDTVDGGDGKDTIDGGDGKDDLKGGNGDDTINGGDGNDTIDGGANNDTIDGGEGNDTIDGGSQNDEIFGGDGNDTIDGGDDKDKIRGGAGDDTLEGGKGGDVIIGGPGVDTYLVSENDGPDIIHIHIGDVPAGKTETIKCGGGKDKVWLHMKEKHLISQPPKTIEDPETGGKYVIDPDCEKVNFTKNDFAMNVDPPFEVYASVGSPGTEIPIFGEEFPPMSTMNVTLAGNVIDSFETYDGGVFESAFLIPLDTEIGTHLLVFENDEYDFEQKLYFTVSESEISTFDSDTGIPAWVKSNAEWWSRGLIDDSTFVLGLEYLINENIIKLNDCDCP